MLNSGVEVQRLALLVDSDSDARHLHAGFLRASHYLVEETADGRVALAKALARPPDIILAETRLPGISGIDLCRILRDDSLTRDIPLVFVTGDDDDMVLRRAEAAGAATVLVKPCVAERLTLAVQQFIERSRHLKERSQMLVDDAARQLRRREQLIGSQIARMHRINSRSFHRHETTAPPAMPPAIVCPRCDAPLRYLKSYIGGVSDRHREQWDTFDCERGCGLFQYRQRTRKLRRIG